MIQKQLTRQLDRVAGRMQRDRLLKWLSLSWFLAAAGGIGLLLLGVLTGWPLHAPQIMWPAAVVLAGLLTIAVAQSRRRHGLDVARKIEQKYPELGERLLAAVEQQPDLHTGHLRYLQQQLIRETLAHSRSHDWLQTVPTRRLVVSFCLHMACLCLFASVAAAMFRFESIASRDRAGTVPSPLPVTPRVDYGVSVEPGDTSIERGTALLVLARFAKKLPADVTLVFTGATNQPQRAVMSKSLDDPLFGGRIPTVEGDLTYRVEYADRRTQQYRVTVFEYPELKRADATVAFPQYTGLPETVIEDTRRLSVVEGSAVTLTCSINKPITSAKLLADGEPEVLLQPANKRGDLFRVILRPKTKQQYRLQLLDAAGRGNKYPPQFVIDVVPNRRPELKLTFPAKDLRVSPLEEVSLEATAWDDFGLKQYGVIYSLAGSGAKTLVLGDTVPAKQQQPITHLLSFEKLDAKPDQLVSYYFFADDFGPDGKVRRTFSDMFCAEVRHFEEIFRQGQQPPGGRSNRSGGGGPQAQKIEKLAKLQKQIINATWKLIRRETATAPTGKYAEDAALIEQSQQAALEQARALGAKVNDPKSKAFVGAVVAQMLQASKSLGDAAETVQVEPLWPALTAEQSAYQALLKLRAREHKVSRGQNAGGGKAGGGSRSNQQLQKLELSNKQNRYESQKRAANRQAALADREQLQVLNRLRELARRQDGVNQKLKELENELRGAKNEQEKEEVRRRLKRLREEQQQLLRDLDKLKNRMDRPENQTKMADSRQGLEQTRSKVLQTSEALKNGQVSKALNAGTRAQRELQQLRDDFRRKTAGQFSEAMKQMRNQARKLADRESRLAEKLKQNGTSGRPTLRYSQDRREIEHALSDQKQHLDDIVNRMRDVIQKAEQSEPLLSKQLYDTVRTTRKEKPKESLEAASRLVSRGLMTEAGEAEKQARRGIDAVKRGIEKAAKGVLGNEIDALKQARNELKELSKSLKNELAHANPDGKQPGHRTQSNTGSRQAGNPQKPSGANRSGTRKAGKQSSQSGSSGKPGRSKGRPGLRGGRQPVNRSQSSSQTEGGTSGGPGGVLTGSNFQEWSDRMRDVEEMIEDPKLRADVSKIRDRARSMRVEFKRHSKEPNWPLVRTSILEPLVELQIRLAEEVANRESKDALVPIDRDPVPKRYTEMVRRYYERLGSGR